MTSCGGSASAETAFVVAKGSTAKNLKLLKVKLDRSNGTRPSRSKRSSPASSPSRQGRQEGLEEARQARHRDPLVKPTGKVRKRLFARGDAKAKIIVSLKPKSGAATTLRKTPPLKARRLTQRRQLSRLWNSSLPASQQRNRDERREQATDDDHRLRHPDDQRRALADRRASRARPSCTTTTTVQKMQHFNRERVPERVVHAKGGGAHGFFEVTEDVSQFTKAGLFQPGERTPMFLRFSTVAGELGSPDTARDPRGFAIKFYTEEGNYDLVGNNTPVFFIRDAAKFSDFIHSQKRLPDTGMRANDMQWDFWTLSPESAHQVTILMSDRGTPRTLRHMHGYGSHTFSWYNAAGEKFWVKYHFKTVQGIENYTEAEAVAMAAEDPDAHRRDLRNAIDDGDQPEWRLKVQVMPFEDAADYRFNPFDLTKVWPHGDYPPIEVGRMVLDRNPEQLLRRGRAVRLLARQPGAGNRPQPRQDADGADLHLPRHPPAPDRRQLRAAADQLAEVPGPLLQPGRADELQQLRRPAVYAPNTKGGPVADPDTAPTRAGRSRRPRSAATPTPSTPRTTTSSRPGTLYREVLDDTEPRQLVENIVGHASAEVSGEVQERVVAYWTQVDSELGARVAAGLKARGRRRRRRRSRCRATLEGDGRPSPSQQGEAPSRPPPPPPPSAEQGSVAVRRRL